MRSATSSWRRRSFAPSRERPIELIAIPLVRLIPFRQVGRPRRKRASALRRAKWVEAEGSREIMLFSSPAFFAFFVVYFCLHLVVPTSYRILLVIGGRTTLFPGGGFGVTLPPDRHT